MQQICAVQIYCERTNINTMSSCSWRVTTLLLIWLSLHEAVFSQNRIVGGNDSNIEDYPYQLSLEGDGYLLCSACILSESWALTAAHCVYRHPVKWLTLRAGSSQSGKDGELHKVSWIIVHEKYDPAQQDFDVALLRVSTPFYFSNKIQPLDLAFRSPQAGDEVTVTGWGYLQEERLRRPKKLQSIELKVFDWNYCKTLYKELTFRMMCAGATGRDTCYGDSGGPLVADGKHIVGIVAWGYACNYDGTPGVYMNITYYGAWIKQNIYNNGGFP